MQIYDNFRHFQANALKIRGKDMAAADSAFYIFVPSANSLTDFC